MENLFYRKVTHSVLSPKKHQQFAKKKIIYLFFNFRYKGDILTS